MMKAAVKDASGFRIGMGIQLFDDDHNQGWDVTTAIITDIKDNVIYFDNRTVFDYIAEYGGTISNGCSIVEAVGVTNVKIADLVVEGTRRQMIISTDAGEAEFIFISQRIALSGM